MQKKMNDNVEKCKEQWNARNVLQSGITESDILNAIVENDYKYLLTLVPPDPDFDESNYILLKNGVAGALGVAGVLVGLTTAGIAISTGVGISVLAALIGIYFDFEGPSGKASAVWNNIRKYVESFVKGEIEQYHYERLVSELQGCAADIKLYTSYLNKGLPYESAALSYCRMAISNFTHIIPSFQQSGYEVLTLPLFTQVAKLHLLLYRDLVLFGKNWGVSDKDHLNDKKNFKQLIQVYTSYAKNIYEQGLKKKEDPNNPSGWEYTCYKVDFGQGNNSPLDLTKKWNDICQYRLGMQLSVLDIIAQFPLLDPENYPMGTIIKQSREVHSPIVGAILKTSDITYQDRAKIKIDKTEDIDKILDVKYEGELMELLMEDSGFNNVRVDSVDVIRQYKDKITDVTRGVDDCIRINGTTKYTRRRFPLSHLLPLEFVKANCTKRGAFNKFSGKYSNGLINSFPTADSPSDCYISPKKHKLSSARLFGKYTRGENLSVSSGIICGFRQKELNPKHILSAQFITQVPAEMHGDKGIKEFRTKNEIINGQNAMYSNIAGNTKEAYLRYDIFGFKNETYQCEVRCRLAYKGNDQSTIDILQNEMKRGTISLTSTESAADSIPGKLGSYIVTESIPLTLKEGRNNIKIVYKSNSKDNELFIDRIEFIPVSTSFTIGETNGKITFTVKPDGTLQAGNTNGQKPISNDSARFWKVFVSGIDTGFSFNGTTHVDTVAMKFNTEFYGETNKWKFPGNSLSVLEFTKTIPQGDIDGKLEIVKIADKNQQHIMQIKKNTIVNLEETVAADYNIFAGGELIYQCKKNVKLKTIMDAFNALNIRAFSLRIKKDQETIQYSEIATDVVNNLFLVQDGVNTPDKQQLKPYFDSYNTRVAKNAIRLMSSINPNLVDLLKSAEVLADTCETTPQNIDFLECSENAQNTGTCNEK